MDSLAANFGQLRCASLTSDPLTMTLTLSGSSLVRLSEIKCRKDRVKSS